MVLCDTFQAPSVEADVGSPELHPHPTNNRAPCDRVMRAAAASQPVFSCHQQYTLLNPQTCWPIGAASALLPCIPVVNLNALAQSCIAE